MSRSDGRCLSRWAGCLPWTGENRGIAIGQVALSGPAARQAKAGLVAGLSALEYNWLLCWFLKIGNIRNREEGHEKGNVSHPCSRRSGDPCAPDDAGVAGWCFVLPGRIEEFAEYRLFFGRNHRNLEVVSDTAWREFLAAEITPRFPDGLTVLDAAGQWRDGSGTILRERTKLVIILTRQGKAAMQRTGKIVKAYKRTFGQEAVLLTVAAACVSF